jgi:type IV pilus assembly protein PilB
LNLVPAELCDRHCVIPVYVRSVRREGDTLFVAMEDPTSEEAIAAVRSAANLPVKPMVAPPSEIRHAIRVYYLGGSSRPGRAKSSAPSAAQVEVEVEVEVEAPVEPAPTKVAEQPAAVAETKPARAAKKRKGKKKGGRMVTLTLLDGTTVRLPAPGSGGSETDEDDESRDSLTASDLIAALVGRAQGADVRDVLPDDKWELLFATLLTLLIRKGLIADWEFVEEWNRRKG